MSDTYKILVVNNEPERLDVMKSLLEDAGYKILRAGSGREALSVAGRELPDLIVSDVLMPDGSGIELCRAARKDLKLRLIPIMLISALNKDVHSVVEALSVGADDYIQAPFNELHLIAKIARLLERKRLERINAEQELWFRSLIENISDVITVLTFDGTITFESPSIEHILGYGRDELIGRNAFDFIHPDDRTIITTYFRRAIRAKEISRTKDYRFLHKDGSWRVLESIGKVFKDPRDGYVVLATSRDITEPKQAQHLLSLFESCVRQTNESIVITNAELERPGPEIIFVNPAFTQMTGYSADELIGKTPRILQGAKTERSTLDMIRQHLSEGKECRGEAINYRKDKTEYWVEWNIAPIRSETGEITHFVSAQQEITRRKQIELLQRQSQRMEAVGQLAGGIAHDFNNMLTAIMGYSDLTLRKLDENDPLRPNIAEISKAAERSAIVTRQLLTFSRNQPYQPKIISLNQIVTEVEAMLIRIIGENIELKTKLAPDTGQIKADWSQIEQVLVNLVVNSRDAMPEGGKVLIETGNVNLGEDYFQTHLASHGGEYVRLTVSDDGTGMDAETQTHIFEPFFTTKDPGKGTGLGLSTVYGIVKQAEGFITVYSEIGFGSTFKIYLPQVNAPPDSRPAKTVSDWNLRGSETILLVEDEETVRNLAREILETNGYRVLTAANGAEALQLSDEFDGEIHLLLTDIVMPLMSGAKLAEKLAEKRPPTRILFMSGYTGDFIRQSDATGREIDFIGKPFTPAELANKVLVVLRK